MQAQADLAQAYSAGAGRTPRASFSGDQIGATFDSGVYDSAGAVSLTGTMTLDGQNDPNAVFIFQINAALSTAASTTVRLINGAQASNVFWQVNGAVSTGASSSFSGTIMASGAITLGAGASLDGGALSDGLVTLSDNTITAPDGLTFTSPPTPTSGLTSTTTDTVLAAGTPGDTGVITYASNTPSVCTVNSTSGALTYLTSGTCTIEATQAADVIDGDGSAASETNITVTVPASYSVTFDGNDSTGGLMAPETNFMPSALSTNAFSRTGYAFAGWNSAADGSGTAYADGAADAFTANQTLFAQWALNASYSVTFDGNDSTAGLMAPETNFMPSALSTNAFSRTGYAFAGWNSAADGSGTAYADGAADAFTANQTLFAQWALNASYSVTFDGNDSTAGLMAPETNFMPSALSTNAFSRTGYAFAGWNSAADGSGTAYADGATDAFTANQTLFAQWALNASYSVTFDGNDSTAGLMAPETNFMPSPLSTNAFSRTGYAFAGWNSAADGSGTAYADGAADAFTANQTLFAQWALNASYSVTFDGNDSTAGLMAPETNFMPSALSTNAFSRTGYAFAGWNSAADGSGTAYADGATDAFTANQTLFAQWALNASYSVTFDGNDSTAGLMAPETNFMPSPLSTNAFSRTGYAFAGWNSAADGSGTAYADGAADAFTANQTLFAQWALNATNPTTTPISPPAAARGYYLVGSDGGVFTFGGAEFYGSTGSLKLQRPIVGITSTVNDGGYWLVASDGGIFSFGDAGYYGSIPGLGVAPAGTSGGDHLNAPIVGMVASSDGGGYFMVAADGGVFAFGDATFEGSCPGIGGCAGAAVAVAPDASGRGYWLITATGHIYSFGDAAYYGAPGPQSSSVTSMVHTAGGLGYWVLLANGSVCAYGDAAGWGGPTGSVTAPNSASAIFATSDGGGYWVTSAIGEVFAYGDAPYDGGMSGILLNGSIIAAAGF